MADEKSSRGSFWTTLPGILTGVAAVLTALTGLWAGLHHTGAADPSPPRATIVDGPPQTTGASAVTPQSQPGTQPQAISAGAGDVSLTARSGATTKLSQKSFHHNMTDTGLALDSGQTVDFDRLRQVDFGTVDGDRHLVAVTLTLADGRTVAGDLPTNYAFKGESDLGPFTIFVQDVKQIVFPR